MSDLKENLNKLANLKEQKKELDDKISELQQHSFLLVEEFAKTQNKFILDVKIELQDTGGIFSIQNRKQWQFPEEVISLREKLKKLEKEHIQKGNATYINSYYLRYDIKKDKSI
jgi:hypothetical protein